MQITPFPVKRSARIEMVPLIDMFFLLLIFFIFGVFSMSMQQGLVVDLPGATAAVASANEEPLAITVTAEETVWLNRDPLTLQTLAPALRARRGGMTDPLVTIQADRRVPHGTVMAVLDAVRQANLQRVSFQTVPEQP